MMWNELGILFILFMPFVYLFVLVYVAFGLYVNLRFKLDFVPDKIDYPKGLSVIIPFRNEEKNVLACLEALKRQTGVDLEIIFVDDHSDDLGPDILAVHSEGLNCKVLPSQGNGKKAALATGIAQASNDLVWTTDADCTLTANTLSSMLKRFHHQKLNMLCGLVQLEGESVFQRLQQAESAALVGLSAFFLNEERPATCNGANLMFRRSVFYQLNGYGDDISTSSGDDDLLMQRFAQLDISKVRYHTMPGLKVCTGAETHWKAFIEQRARWASKHTRYKFPYNSILLVLMTSRIFFFFFLLFLSVFFTSAWFYIPFFLLVLADFLMAAKIRRVIDFKLWAVILLPFYQLYIPFAWLKSREAVVWKGRRIQGPEQKF